MALCYNENIMSALICQTFSSYDKTGISTLLYHSVNIANKNNAGDKTAVANSVPIETLLHELKASGLFEKGSKSSNAAFYENLKCKKQKCASTHVKWDDKCVNLTEKDKEELFVYTNPVSSTNYGKSVFGNYMMNGTPENAPKFSRYIPYDGRFAGFNETIRKVTVFVMPTEKVENKPDSLIVSVIDCATVGQLIGVVLNRLESDHNMILEPEISNYDLHLAEEGQAETCIPALKKTSLVKNCKFRELALVRVKHLISKEFNAAITINWQGIDFNLSAEAMNESLHSLLLRNAIPVLKISDFDLNEYMVIVISPDITGSGSSYTSISSLSNISNEGVDWNSKVKDISSLSLRLIRFGELKLNKKNQFDLIHGASGANEPSCSTKASYPVSITHGEDQLKNVNPEEVYRVKMVNRLTNCEASFSILGDMLVLTPIEKSLFAFNKSKNNIVVLSSEIESCRITGGLAGKNRVMIQLIYRKNQKLQKTVDMEVKSSDSAKIIKLVNMITGSISAK